MFAQFGEREDTADDALAIVRILTEQRERRQHGSDEQTAAMLEQIDLLTREMGFPPDQKRSLMYGCLLRDIGLIEQPDALVRDPQRLSPQQAAEWRQHPERGAELLEDLKLPSQILDVVRYHHERFNGEGFPAGLTGRRIPLLARVVALVEGYVELITGAGGKPQLSPRDAGKRILKDQEGRYDPDLAVVFLSAISKQHEQRGEETGERVRSG
jgi:putative two-component system response regulator